MVMRPMMVTYVVTLWRQRSSRPAGGAINSWLHLMLVAITILLFALSIVAHIAAAVAAVTLTTVTCFMSFCDGKIVVLRVVSEAAASLEIHAGEVRT